MMTSPAPTDIVATTAARLSMVGICLIGLLAYTVACIVPLLTARVHVAGRM